MQTRQMMKQWQYFLPLIALVAIGMVLAAGTDVQALTKYSKAEDAVGGCATAVFNLQGKADRMHALIGRILDKMENQRKETLEIHEKKGSKKKAAIPKQKGNAGLIVEDLKEIGKLYKAVKKKCGTAQKTIKKSAIELD